MDAFNLSRTDLGMLCAAVGPKIVARDYVLVATVSPPVSSGPFFAEIAGDPGPRSISGAVLPNLTRKRRVPTCADARTIRATAPLFSFQIQSLNGRQRQPVLVDMAQSSIPASLSEPTFAMPTSARGNAAVYAGPDAPVVVVAEDDDDLRTLLILTLGQRYTVFAVSDGVLALDLLLKIRKPAAMLLDINMPRVDGLTVAARLKEHPWLRSVPVLFLTARDSPEDMRAGFETGARCYLTKPFRSQDLLEKLAEIIAPTANFPNLS